MLPYKLRPPVYGRKLKEAKKKDGTVVSAASFSAADEETREHHKSGNDEESLYRNHPLADGGPVERAMKSDLLELRKAYFHSLRTPRGGNSADDVDRGDGTSNSGNNYHHYHSTTCHQTHSHNNRDETQQLTFHHDALGDAFRSFKRAFQQTKFAVIHGARTIPPRCDRDAHSQMLYAACLSLLEGSFDMLSSPNLSMDKKRVEEGVRTKTREQEDCNENEIDETTNSESRGGSNVRNHENSELSPSDMKSSFHDRHPDGNHMELHQRDNAAINFWGDSNNIDLDCSVQHAAFAVFALYALYKTNPLPDVPPPAPPRGDSSSSPSSSSASPRFEKSFRATASAPVGREGLAAKSSHRDAIEMLPLGLKDADNLRLLYRRAFRGPIRMGRNHFGLLLRLRDLCLTVMSRCEIRRMRKWRSLIVRDNTDIDDGDDEDEGAGPVLPAPTANERPGERVHEGNNCWSCICGVAMDVIQIIDRMQHERIFDLCEYSGPCSLEGLAGSGGYYRRVVLKKEPLTFSSLRWDGSTIDVTDETFDAERGGTDLRSELNVDELKKSFEHYQHSLDSIAVPAGGRETNGTGRLQTNQASMIQKTLAPLFQSRQNLSGSHWWDKTLMKLSRICDMAEENQGDFSRWTESELFKEIDEIQNEVGRADLTGVKRAAPVGTTARIIHRLLDSRSGESTTMTPSKKEISGVSTAGEALSERPYHGHGVQPTDEENGRILEMEGKEKSADAKELTHKVCYRIVMPTDLPLTLQAGIQNALNRLIEGDGTSSDVSLGANDDDNRKELNGAPLEEPSGKDIQTVLREGNEGGSAVDERSDNTSLFMKSTHEDASVQSLDTGQGGAALRALLSSVETKGNRSQREATRKPLPTRKIPEDTRKNSFAVRAQDDFLNIQLDWSNDGKEEQNTTETGIISSAPSSSQDDDVSIAASGIGQNALRVLISHVHDDRRKQRPSDSAKRKGKSVAGKGAAQKQSPKASLASKKRPIAAEGGRRKQRLRKLNAGTDERGKPTSKKRTRLTSISHEGTIESDQEKHSMLPTPDVEEFSVSSRRGGGKAALEHLLAKVDSASVQIDPTGVSEVEQGVRSQNAASVAESVQSVISESNDEDESLDARSGEGRAALDALLARVVDTG